MALRGNREVRCALPIMENEFSGAHRRCVCVAQRAGERRRYAFAAHHAKEKSLCKLSLACMRLETKSVDCTPACTHACAHFSRAQPMRR